jgi:hypothetical protein
VRIVTVDRLGDGFLQAVESGDWLSIKENGTVTRQGNRRVRS